MAIADEDLEENTSLFAADAFCGSAAGLCVVSDALCPDVAKLQSNRQG